MIPAPVANPTVVPEYDVLVIGAGFGGLRLPHELRGRGLDIELDARVVSADYEEASNGGASRRRTVGSYEPVSFAGKRVGVIGTGATAVRIIPEVAHTAAHLTVFQRTPTDVIPSRNHPLEAHQRAAIKANYGDIWTLCRKQVFAFPIERSGRKIDNVSPQEHQRILESGWEPGASASSSRRSTT